MLFELPTILLGDFNLDIPNPTHSKVKDYIHSVDSYFFVQCIGEPTHIAARSATLLDHIWINCEDRLISSSVLTGPSDHKMIQATLNLKIQHSRGDVFTCRSYRGLSLAEFQEDLAKIDWKPPEDNVENEWLAWKRNFLDVLNRHTKIICIKQGRNSKLKPWMNDEILSLSEENMQL